MRATYVRLYADEKGQSHFEDVAIDLLPGFAVPPAEPLGFGSFLNLGKSRFISAPAAWRGDTPHPVPRRLDVEGSR